MSDYSVHIDEDPKSPMPFRMIEGMMGAYPFIAIMGLMLVLLAVILGATILGDAREDFLFDAKAIREASPVGSDALDGLKLNHALETWLPSVKLLGLGMMLLGITMALGTIATRLRTMGKVVRAHIPDANRPAEPELPSSRRIFQMSAMMGIMILMAAAVVSIVETLTTVTDYWDNTIATLNAADIGSDLLGQLGTQAAIGGWLPFFRLFGMGMLFFGITIALTVIIGALRTQAELLSDYYKKNK